MAKGDANDSQMPRQRRQPIRSLGSASCPIGPLLLVLGSCLQQLADHRVRVAPSRDFHGSGPRAGVAQGRQGARGEQRSHNVFVLASRGAVQSSAACLIGGGIGIRPGAEQRLHPGEFPPEGQPQERRA